MKKKQKEANEIKKFYLGLFLLFVLTFSLAAYIKINANPKIENETRNGFEFINTGTFWLTELRGGIPVEFRYAPSEVDHVEISGDPVMFLTYFNKYDVDATYFTFNPGDNFTSVALLAADVGKYLNRALGKHMTAACMTEHEDCADRPIITCEENGDDYLIIQVEQSETPSVSLEKDCLIIKGSEEELVKAYTKLLFIWYGII